MTDYLPQDILSGLEMARKARAAKKSRFRVTAGDRTFTILRLWEDGFALDSEAAPHLRGLVDIYDGARHMAQCLIVASEEDSGEMVYDFKRSTPAADAPARDYEVDANAPVALLPHH